MKDTFVQECRELYEVAGNIPLKGELLLLTVKFKECLDAIDKLKKTNRKLNRRCQFAESVANENVEKCKKARISFGRMLANYAAIQAIDENAKLKKELEHTYSHESVRGLVDHRDATIKELTAQNEKLKEFARKAIKEICWGHMDGGSIQELAVEMGLIKWVANNEVCEYQLTEILKEK